MLGDSVIGVKHCMDPTGGRITRATWVLAVASAACLAASAFGFAVSVGHAADTAVRHQAWIAAHKPAQMFRPPPLPSGAGWLATGGLVLGIAGAVLTLVRARRERVSPYYRIGTAPGVELPTAHAPSPAFPLVAPSGDDFVLNYAAGIDGEVIVDGAPVALSALAAQPSRAAAGAFEIAIPRNARIRARIGQATVMISAVERPRRHARAGIALDHRVAAYAAGSLALHLAVWAVLRATPPDEMRPSLSVDAAEELSLRAAGIAFREPPPERPTTGGGDAAEGEPNAAPKMALPSGATGDPRTAADGRLKLARNADTPDASPQMSRDDAIKAAQHAGIFGSELLMSGVKSLSARVDLANGFDDENINGAIYGADGGPGGGVFGGGVRGFDIGGGCAVPPCGTGPGTSDLYAARYDTIRKGRRTGDRFSLRDSGGPGIPSRVAGIPTTRIGTPTVQGGYDRALIRRYIRRQLNEITFCYEKQLLARPALAGEVQVSFLISGTGVVQSAVGSGLDPEVASCVAGVLQRIQFPAPSDGSGVQVHYPFRFVAAGS